MTNIYFSYKKCIGFRYTNGDLWKNQNPHLEKYFGISFAHNVNSGGVLERMMSGNQKVGTAHIVDIGMKND